MSDKEPNRGLRNIESNNSETQYLLQKETTEYGSNLFVSFILVLFLVGIFIGNAISSVESGGK